MKNLIIIIFCLLLVFLSTQFAKAQCNAGVQYWCKLGNAGVLSTDWLGTYNAANLNIKTFDISRMTIMGSGLNTGFTGFGNNLFFTPQSFVHLNRELNTDVYQQFTNFNTQIGLPTTTDGLKIGIAANGDAEVRQQENFHLNIFTDNTQRMTIRNNGLVGVNTISPGFQLDVADGININNPMTNHYYMINGDRVLSNFGISNIFVGEGTGASITSGAGSTLVGYNAGQSITSGQSNTFIGSDAGSGTSTGSENSFLGYKAGVMNSTGVKNTFLGYLAGNHNISGEENVYIGYFSGVISNYESFNTVVGSQAGYYLFVGGSKNAFFGYKSGIDNQSGNENSFFGYMSNCGLSNLNNATAIGANSMVMNNDAMILGDNDVNVGVGVSASPIRPARKLELYDNVNSQLRLSTDTRNPNLTLGTWTDFQTMATGDLQINNSLNGTFALVGINNGIGALTRTLDVNGNGRFRTLPAAVNNSLNQLVVANANGELFVRDVATLPGGGGGVNVCGSPSVFPLENWIPRFSDLNGNEVCNSIMLEGNYIIPGDAIGIGHTSGNLNGILDVNGDMNLNNTTDHYRIAAQSVLFVENNGVFVGQNAGITNTGTSNVVVGSISSGNLSGNNNTMVGVDAGADIASSTYNTCVGFQSGMGITTTFTSDNNTYLGSQAGLNNAQPNNTMIGVQSGIGNDGASNVIIGYQSVFASATTPGDGQENCIIGVHAGYELVDGDFNVAVGRNAGRNCADGSDNVYVGRNAGINNTSATATYGDNNVYVGARSGQAALTNGTSNCTYLGFRSNTTVPAFTNINNATAVGASAEVTCDDCMVLGSVTGNNQGLNQTHVGIGYINPTGDATPGAHGNFLLYVNSEADADTAAGPQNSAFFNGRICASGIWTFSDSILKDNIQPLSPIIANNAINQLNPTTFTYLRQGNPQLNLPSGTHAGLIAEQVEQVLPALVTSMTAPAILDTVGLVVSPALTFKTIDYPGLIPYLIAAVKELQQKNDSNEQALSQLQLIVANCCAVQRQADPENSEQGNLIDVKLNNAKAIILNQNVPNPFSEQTTITYFLTDDVKKAQIFFHDNKGVILKIVEITEKGEGQLKVFAEDLSSGGYSYSLVADGKLIETKKMVKQN